MTTVGISPAHGSLQPFGALVRAARLHSRLPMRVRCATQRDHVFHPEMNYSQTQLDQLDRLTERWVADHLQKGKTSKKDKELVTLEIQLKLRKSTVQRIIPWRVHWESMGSSRVRQGFREK